MNQPQKLVDVHLEADTRYLLKQSALVALLALFLYK